MSNLRRLRVSALFMALVAALYGLVAVAVAPVARAAVTDCSQWGVTSLQGGAYNYQQNEWNSTATQCASIDSGSGAWSITQANFGLPTNGAPATYPSSYKGCHWGNCTSGSGLPIQVSQLGTVTTSVSTTQPGSGAYDVAYDIWFNSTPTTSGQPDGTELMIWLNSRGGSAVRRPDRYRLAGRVLVECLDRAADLVEDHLVRAAGWRYVVQWS